MTPDLRQMRYFAEVAAQRNITRAAASLQIAQQALSQQIKAMEEMLGSSLLDRRARPLELTPVGRVFQDYGDAAVGQLGWTP